MRVNGSNRKKDTFYQVDQTPKIAPNHDCLILKRLSRPAQRTGKPREPAPAGSIQTYRTAVFLAPFFFFQPAARAVPF